MFINGTTEYNVSTHDLMSDFGEGGRCFTMNHDGTGDTNHMRIGNPSHVSDGISIFRGMYTGNFAADITVDEWYVWNQVGDTTVTQALKNWKYGRYYKPLKQQEGIYTSGRVNFECHRRYLPPASAVRIDGVNVATETALEHVQANEHRHHIIGASWTWHGEETIERAGKLQRILFNYNTSLGAAPRVPTHVVTPRVRVRFMVNDQVKTDWLEDDTGARADAFYDADHERLRYQIKIDLQGADLSTILLATPVLDDITLYVACNAPTYVEYLKVEL